MFDLTADEYTLIMQPLTKAKEYFKPGSELSKELAHVTRILDKKNKGMPQGGSCYSSKTKEQKIYEFFRHSD